MYKKNYSWRLWPFSWCLYICSSDDQPLRLTQPLDERLSHVSQTLCFHSICWPFQWLHTCTSDAGHHSIHHSWSQECLGSSSNNGYFANKEYTSTLKVSLLVLKIISSKMYSEIVSKFEGKINGPLKQALVVLWSFDPLYSLVKGYVAYKSSIVHKLE